MAIPPSHRFILTSFFFFFFFFLLVSFTSPATSSSSILKLPTSILTDLKGDDVHEILPRFNIPGGLFPDVPNTYTLAADGSITIHLSRSCYVHFGDQLVYYRSRMTGKMSAGAISDVSGIQAKKFFFWLPVTGLSVDAQSNSIEFHVGALSESLPADQFQDVPRCMDRTPRKSIPLASS